MASLRSLTTTATLLCACVHAISPAALSGKDADQVTSIPGFEDEFASLGFEVYSGYLDVTTPAETTGGYDALKIHYELHTCAKGKNCPLAIWHQGGPGGSAVYGAWTEMGPFQLMAQGPVFNNKTAWNKAAHMLYLESPAGSSIAGSETGFSSCSKDGEVQRTCSWDDVSQAVAYAHTIEAFLAKFPEYASSELFLTGESYAGQYIPNIAYHVINSNYSFTITGVAVGNGCWGGTETSIQCNGPHAEKNDIDIYYGKGMLPSKMYDAIQKECDWEAIAQADDDQDDGAPLPSASAACNKLLEQADDAVGPHNIYNVYDDCPLSAEWHAANPRVSQWALKRFARSRPTHSRAKLDEDLKAEFGLADAAAGFPWNCESDPALDAYFTRDDVQKALHLEGAGSRFDYDLSGPASQLLWPDIVKKMRTLIYNGDADMCVPYKGNEELVAGLESGSITEAEAWRPWFRASDDSNNYAPAGYVTTYSVSDKAYESKGPDFAFLTIRLAGHMVPTFQPEAALTFVSNFVSGSAY